METDVNKLTQNETIDGMVECTLPLSSRNHTKLGENTINNPNALLFQNCSIDLKGMEGARCFSEEPSKKSKMEVIRMPISIVEVDTPIE